MIGAGGMGVVYEAFDRERGRRVAVKTLLRFSPGALYRFKHEFRTLSDVIHPNLVHLYELVVTDRDDAFFVMELVDGVDFVHYVRRTEAASALGESVPPTAQVPLPSSSEHIGHAQARFEAGAKATDHPARATGSALPPTSSGSGPRCGSLWKE